jgi:hypothetical protein
MQENYWITSTCNQIMKTHTIYLGKTILDTGSTACLSVRVNCDQQNQNRRAAEQATPGHFYQSSFSINGLIGAAGL